MFFSKISSKNKRSLVKIFGELAQSESVLFSPDIGTPFYLSAFIRKDVIGQPGFAETISPEIFTVFDVHFDDIQGHRSGKFTFESVVYEIVNITRDEFPTVTFETRIVD